MQGLSVRPLGIAHAVAVRDLRLEALRLFPENFATSWEEEADRPILFWEHRLQGPARTFGADVSGNLLGMVAVSLKSRVKAAHVAEISSMYVRAGFHRSGVGAALMQFAMEFLRVGEFSPRAKIATLNVMAKNEGAIRLYKRHGFTVCGQLDRELFVDGKFYDELLMRTGIS